MNRVKSSLYRSEIISMRDCLTVFGHGVLKRYGMVVMKKTLLIVVVTCVMMPIVVNASQESHKARVRQTERKKRSEKSRKEFEKTGRTELHESLTNFSYPEECLAGLTEAEREEFLETVKLLPGRARVIALGGIKDSRSRGYRFDYALPDYIELLADKSGYKYVQKLCKQDRGYIGRNVKKDEAIKVHKMFLELLMFEKPLILLQAENYTLQQVVLQFNFREAVDYLLNREYKNPNGSIKSQLYFHLQATAIITLGEKYNRPEWIRFGKDMQMEIPPIDNLIKQKAKLKEELCLQCMRAHGFIK